jgi:diguanylate cyclase (GGDEF)-like protein/PAS domain S-box-containing protein
MGVNKKPTFIKTNLMRVFTIAVLLSIMGIALMLFVRWYRSAEHTMQSLANDVNERIYQDITTFLQEPAYFSTLTKLVIENNLIDLSEAKKRDGFFASVMTSYDHDVYSFSYGTAQGEYYGARKNQNDVIEIYRSNASTQGHSRYYSVNEDLSAGDMVIDAGPFDPRTRAWYQIAVERQKPAYSSVYPHFVMNDLTVSAARPVYDHTGQLQGVVGTHILLSNISTYLNKTVRQYDGLAIIVEKESQYLIANTLGLDNFTVEPDNTITRKSIANTLNPDLIKALDHYKDSSESAFTLKGESDNLYFNVRELHAEGLDWIVISAIPAGLLMADVKTSMIWTAFLAILALTLFSIVFRAIIDRMAAPVTSLLQVSEALASGDLSPRVPIVRNNEIGSISQSLNKVADKMQDLINNLEVRVQQRTDELTQVNRVLEEKKDQLRLILDSSAEAIYGIDMQGLCTFCNSSSIKLLGYESEDEILGRNIHNLIHHSRIDGTPITDQECKIYQSIRNNQGIVAYDEVFWRADGTCFPVEYRSYPQVRDGQVVGGVVTFNDITERKQREERIRHLSYHDPLTGLYNRRRFDEERVALDAPANLPLSVIFADLNGLKLTNDIFGHEAGDQLIKTAAEILKKSCRERDVLARIGGDEFVIMLPNTDASDAAQILLQIRQRFADVYIENINHTVSLGFNTKTNLEQPFSEVLSNAENAMYKDKTVNRLSINAANSIIDSLHIRSPREKEHSIVVSQLCGDMGVALHLSEPEIDQLKRVGYLHDIGKITLDEQLLNKDSLTEDEYQRMQQHAATGYRILNLFDDTLDLAEYVYGHHERWDGTGYPRGLKGTQIPLIARIISIAETYDRVSNRGDLPREERKQIALREIKSSSGKQFDPDLAELFVRMMTQ